MKYFDIEGKEYKLVIGNGEDDIYRRSFNALTEKTFGFNFEKWYQDGYWKNQYIPYSLMDGDKVVSNVSVNIMNFEVYGKTKRYIQLGTVMTDIDYRNKGLARVIMEKIIKEWKDKCDLIYLFANDTVFDFYPKFGFDRLSQYQCEKLVNIENGHVYAKKLNMSDKGDMSLVFEKANSSASFAKVSMLGNAELTMFYCTLFMNENVYYIQDYDAVVIADFAEGTIGLLDVFCKEEVSLDKILNYMVNENIKKVKLYFTPKETSSYTLTQLGEEDVLFVLGRDKMLFADKQFMFPVLSHT
ncbi:GNAT family N-acetyltransferase [Clostridium chromiireducens]|uniref:GNAT family N-acetyltransferase n=1 Tax=Clostridium chromiireducens TaxID=225345 RepID=A0A964W3T7_9CLOT|nr:GNAT family N-acetyltransferase [Clostridium chromiireducens]MVX65695.1 GNAT family N-acetyltransferase [Clostridium chromiireducens]